MHILKKYREDVFRRFNMKQVSYKKLWHTLIDRNLRKNDLLNATGISSSTLARMVSGQPVNVEILLRICSALDCDFSDIMEAVPEGHRQQKSRIKNTAASFRENL